MEKFQGKAIFRGIAIGKILFHEKAAQPVKRSAIEDTQKEWERYEMARDQAIEELHGLYEKAVKEVGEVNAQIFEVHAMMLEDDDYNESVRNIIENQKLNAAYATATTGDNFAEIFANMEDEYFRARSVDVKDISERVIHILNGGKTSGQLTEPVIIVAEDLAPSETVQMDKDKLLAFVTKLGSSNSHTAILARNMNIPALINIDIQESWNGKTAIVDGKESCLIVDPDEEVMALYKRKLQEEEEKQKLLQELKGKETVTKSGKQIKLYANIGKASDVAAVLANDAGGIGLFRSEFLYLDSDTYPTEDEQFAAYRQVAEMMGGKKGDHPNPGYRSGQTGGLFPTG